MSRILEKVQEGQVRQDVPAFRPGDTVRVHVRLKEADGEKERLQPFEGVVISKRGRLAGATFTIRRVSFGIGVERTFPDQFADDQLDRNCPAGQSSPRQALLFALSPGQGRTHQTRATRRATGRARSYSRVEVLIARPPLFLVANRAYRRRALC